MIKMKKVKQNESLVIVLLNSKGFTQNKVYKCEKTPFYLDYIIVEDDNGDKRRIDKHFVSFL